MYKYLIILSVILIAGCQPQNQDESNNNIRETSSGLTVYDDREPDFEITFETRLIIKPGEQEAGNLNTFIGEVDNFAVDDSNRIYVYSDLNIHVLNPEGNYITSMGGEGRGPGEFEGIGPFTAPVVMKVSGNRLYAWDKELQRINVYSLESFSSSNTILLNPENWENVAELAETSSRPHNYYPLADSTLLLEFKELFPSRDGGFLNVRGANPIPEVEKFLRSYQINNRGQIISDKITERKDVNFHLGKAGNIFPNIPPHLPSTRSSLMEVTDEGNIYTAWTEDVLITSFDLDGNQSGAYHFPNKNADSDRNDIIDISFEKASSSQKKIFEDTDFPETWPALNLFLIDSMNRFWISTITDDKERYLWWILDSNGEVLANFEWSGRRYLRHSEPNEIRMIKNGYMYIHKVDQECDQGCIIKYKYELTE